MERRASAWADGRPAENTLVLDAIAGHSTELLALARRHSMCADDASDAYQRALLALLRHVDRVQPQAIVAWLRVVVRREAVTLRRQRLTLVGARDGVVDPVDTAPPPDERALDAECRDRSAEALAALKPAQRRALLLKARGYSYAEIAEMTGWSRRQVDRALTEGRRALRERVADLETGRRCRRIAPVLSALADGEAQPADLSRARAHLRHCGHCRATLADYRRAPSAAAALAPTAVLTAVDSDHSDPSGLARLFDLIVNGAHERTLLAAHKLQVGIEAAATGKLALAAASASALVGGGLAVGGQIALPKGGHESAVTPSQRAVVAAGKRSGPAAAGGAVGGSRAVAPRSPSPRASIRIRRHRPTGAAAAVSVAGSAPAEFAPGAGTTAAPAASRQVTRPVMARAAGPPPSPAVHRTAVSRSPLPEFTP